MLLNTRKRKFPGYGTKTGLFAERKYENTEVQNYKKMLPLIGQVFSLNGSKLIPARKKRKKMKNTEILTKN